jgi:ribose 5-phosphate isomerase B
LCWNEESARLTKEHNNANMIALGARMVSEDEAMKIVDAWLKAEYQGGRHQKRIDKIEMD